MPLRGSLPLTAQGSSSAGSVVIWARPLTRNVSRSPGTKKISPTPGEASRLQIVSTRLLPSRSGISSVSSSMTWTKPGASPFGEASQRPDGSVVAMTRNGDSAMKRARMLFEPRQLLLDRPLDRLAVDFADLSPMSSIDVHLSPPVAS